MEEMITVKSTIKATVVLLAPSLNFKKTWAQKGTFQKIPKSTLLQIMYEPGVEYLFKSGILFVDDAATRVEMGLEEAPAANIELNDAYCKKLLTGCSFDDFCKEVENLSHDQSVELARYCIDNNCVDYKRTKIIEDKSGVVIHKLVIDNLQNSEEKPQ